MLFFLSESFKVYEKKYSENLLSRRMSHKNLNKNKLSEQYNKIIINWMNATRLQLLKRDFLSIFAWPKATLKTFGYTINLNAFQFWLDLLDVFETRIGSRWYIIVDILEMG